MAFRAIRDNSYRQEGTIQSEFIMKKKAAVKKALKYQDTYNSVIQSQSIVVSETTNRLHVTIEVGSAQIAGGVFTQLICIDPDNLRNLINTLADLYQYRLNRDAENDNS